MGVNKLKELRKEKGITQVELANMLGTSQKNVSHWEVGRNYPRPHVMQELEDYFKVPKEVIFFEAFNNKTLL
jgi:transcriptional regulator with XRE-family HTH domain